MRCTECAQPVAHRLSLDHLGPDVADEAPEPTSFADQDWVPDSNRSGEDAVLTVEKFDGLAVGAHHDAESGNVDREKSHALQRSHRAPNI
jgi:hypothetical protein